MADDLPYDPSDEKQVEKRKLEVKKREADLRSVLQDFLAVRPARDWVWQLLVSADIFGTSFVRGQPDASTFNEGRRALGLQILADIQKHAPESLFTMMREQGK